MGRRRSRGPRDADNERALPAARVRPLRRGLDGPAAGCVLKNGCAETADRSALRSIPAIERASVVGVDTHLGMAIPGVTNMLLLYVPQSPAAFCKGATCADPGGMGRGSAGFAMTTRRGRFRRRRNLRASARHRRDARSRGFPSSRRPLGVRRWERRGSRSLLHRDSRRRCVRGARPSR
jgi:hypothetical protein